jgi:hypothetical protein
MLQASAQPYAGLNRLSPFWLVATRDLDSRGIVYVEADVLGELDGLLSHVLHTYADDAASQRVLSKCAPSASAYFTWLQLCNYPLRQPSIPRHSEVGQPEGCFLSVGAGSMLCAALSSSAVPQWRIRSCGHLHRPPMVPRWRRSHESIPAVRRDSVRRPLLCELAA